MADKFFIGRCALDLYLEDCHSLKDKRRIVKSLKDRMKRQFNVSICEYGDVSLWQRTQLGIVTCGNDRKIINATINKAIEFLEHNHTIALLNHEMEVI